MRELWLWWSECLFRHDVVSQRFFFGLMLKTTAGSELDDRQRALICRGTRGVRGATASRRQLLEEDDDTIARLRKLKYQTYSH